MKSPQQVKSAIRASLNQEEVRGILHSGQSVELLRALGLVTERGGASADSHRKLKQIAAFVRLVEPAMRDILSRFPDPVIVDAGAGKSYLGLVLAEVFLKPAGRGRLIAVETRPELAARATNIAAALKIPGFTSFRREFSMLRYQSE